jgi:hypothetical protein
MSENTTFIYALIDPYDNQIKYIGKSDDPSIRLIEHIRKSKYISTYKNNWIKSLINKNVSPELMIIDEVLNTEWSFWEKHWISIVKSWGFKLTNLTDGGDGGNLGENINKKISEKLKNRKYSLETITKMSESAKKRKISDEGRKSLSEKRKGKNNPMFGKKQSELCVYSKYKPILQLDLEGNLIREWLGIKLASTNLNINKNTIRMVCQNLRKTAGGFKWKYK